MRIEDFTDFMQIFVILNVRPYIFIYILEIFLEKEHTFGCGNLPVCLTNH